MKNSGNVITRIGREITITDLHRCERHAVITDGTTMSIGKLIVRARAGWWMALRNDCLS